MPRMQPRRIIEFALYASDLEAAEHFYVSVLGLQVAGRRAGEHVFFKHAGCMLLIFNPLHTSQQQVSVGGGLIPRHGATGPGHLAFAVRDDEIDAWREHLQQSGVSIESEVSWPGGGRSIYFRDPAENSVELVTPRLWDLPAAD